MMNWLTRSNNDEEAAYHSANPDGNIPVAHAVAMSDSQDFVRPPPMNPSLQSKQQQQPYQAVATVVNPSAATAAYSSKPQQQAIISPTRATTTRTYTIPAGSSSLQQPSQQHQHSHQSHQERQQEFTRHPQLLSQCPECHALNARTRVRTYPSWLTWCACVGLVFLFWPLCWLPLVVDSLKQTDHYCLVCGRIVGSVSACKNCCVTTSV